MCWFVGVVYQASRQAKWDMEDVEGGAHDRYRLVVVSKEQSRASVDGFE